MKTLWSDETEIVWPQRPVFSGLKVSPSHLPTIWRLEGDAFNSKNTIPTIKHGGGHIMLQGCPTASGSSTLNK